MKSFFPPALWGSLNSNIQTNLTAIFFLLPLILGIYGNVPGTLVSLTLYIGVSITASIIASNAGLPVMLIPASDSSAASIYHTTRIHSDLHDGAQSRLFASRNPAGDSAYTCLSSATAETSFPLIVA